jgi:hypothetical protein
MATQQSEPPTTTPPLTVTPSNNSNNSGLTENEQKYIDNMFKDGSHFNVIDNDAPCVDPQPEKDEEDYFPIGTRVAINVEGRFVNGLLLKPVKGDKPLLYKCKYDKTPILAEGGGGGQLPEPQPELQPEPELYFSSEEEDSQQTTEICEVEVSYHPTGIRNELNAKSFSIIQYYPHHKRGAMNKVNWEKNYLNVGDFIDYKLDNGSVVTNSQIISIQNIYTNKSVTVMNSDKTETEVEILNITELRKNIIKIANIASIKKNTVDFCGDHMEWFMKDNQALLTSEVNGLADLVKTNTELRKFTDTSCILASGDEEFKRMLEVIMKSPEYNEHLRTVLDLKQFIRRLIYNRPLVFCGTNDDTRGLNGPKNNNLLDDVAGKFNPYVKEEPDEPDEKYHLISLAALVGCWSLTPIIHSGIKETNETNNRLREAKFFGDGDGNGDYNTKAYVCGLVGARFEKADQMEHAYIRDSANQTNLIHIELRKFFVSKIESHKNKYFHTYHGGRGAITKRNLYRERIRFTFELFLKQCSDTYEKTKKRIFPVFTGLGTGVWAKDSGLQDDINDILEDSILSILTDNPKYLEAFPGIRFSSFSKKVKEDGKYKDVELYDDISRDCGSISDKFNQKYKEHYQLLFNNSFLIYHTHFKRGSKQSFFTQTELNTLLKRKDGGELGGEEGEEVEGLGGGEGEEVEGLGGGGGEGGEVTQAFLFAWDGNAFVGNEYWAGMMSETGDPVTISSCCLGQLCNPFINPKMLNKIEPSFGGAFAENNNTDTETEVNDEATARTRREARERERRDATTLFKTEIRPKVEKITNTLNDLRFNVCSTVLGTNIKNIDVNYSTIKEIQDIKESIIHHYEKQAQYDENQNHHTRSPVIVVSGVANVENTGENLTVDLKNLLKELNCPEDNYTIFEEILKTKLWNSTNLTTILKLFIKINEIHENLRIAEITDIIELLKKVTDISKHNEHNEHIIKLLDYFYQYWSPEILTEISKQQGKISKQQGNSEKQKKQKIKDFFLESRVGLNNRLNEFISIIDKTYHWNYGDIIKLFKLLKVRENYEKIQRDKPPPKLRSMRDQEPETQSQPMNWNTISNIAKKEDFNSEDKYLYLIEHGIRYGINYDTIQPVLEQKWSFDNFISLLKLDTGIGGELITELLRVKLTKEKLDNFLKNTRSTLDDFVKYLTYSARRFNRAIRLINEGELNEIKKLITNAKTEQEQQNRMSMRMSQRTGY